MRRTLATYTVALAATLTAAAAKADLVISGVMDGTLSGGVPKLVELYVINDVADLSVYSLENFNTPGSTTPTNSLQLSGSATAGTFLYATNSSTDQSELDTWFGSGVVTFGTNAFQGAGSQISINGDDSLQLSLSGAPIDQFGVPGTDGTGEAWEYLDGWAYRNDDVAATTTFSDSDWTFSGTNVLDGAGSNAGAGADAFPIGTFSFTTTAVIPEPTAFLFGSALAGVLGMSISRRKGRVA